MKDASSLGSRAGYPEGRPNPVRNTRTAKYCSCAQNLSMPIFGAVGDMAAAIVLFNQPFEIRIEDAEDKTPKCQYARPHSCLRGTYQVLEEALPSAVVPIRSSG